MRWVTYKSVLGPRTGLVVDSEIMALAPGIRLIDLIAGGVENLAEQAESAQRAPSEVRQFSDVELLAPIEPPAIRDFLCFLDHLRNFLLAYNSTLDPAFEQIPGFYFSNPAAVTGPYNDVSISPGSRRFDFELEAAAVIGRPGCDLSVEEAEDHIVGYTIFCDWSARDLMDHEYKLNLGPAKSKDTANTLGPMLVTADELAPFASGRSFGLEMSAWVNGERVGGGRMDQMFWSFAELASYASRGTSLRTGDVLGSGTVPTGCLAELSALHGDDFRGWLVPGDVVRLEIEQLGFIEQRLVASPDPHRLRTGF